MILLGLEAALWLASSLFEGAIVVVMAVSLAALSLLAILLLEQAPGKGIWIGLGLQGLFVRASLRWQWA